MKKKKKEKEAEASLKNNYIIQQQEKCITDNTIHWGYMHFVSTPQIVQRRHCICHENQVVSCFLASRGYLPSRFCLMSTGPGNSDVPIFDPNFKKYKHIDRFVTRFDESVSKLKLKEKAYAKGEAIFHAGRVTNGEAYMIISGAVDCMAMDPVSGNRKAFNRHGAGEYFGEICLLSSNFRHLYDCVAAEKTTVIAFERASKNQDITASLYKINEDRSSKSTKDKPNRKPPIAIFNVPFYIDSRVYRKGEFIYRENDLSVGFYVLLCGQLKRTLNDKEESFIDQGEIFGVRRIMMPGKVRSSCEVTATAKVVRFIPAETDVLADSLLRKSIQAALKSYKKKLGKDGNAQRIPTDRKGNSECPNPDKPAYSLSPKWSLIKKSVVNSTKVKALKSFASRRRNIADKCKCSLLKMIKVAHKPVEVQVEPMGLGARRQSTSVQMMVNEQRYFHKKGVESTGSIVDTQLPNAYKFSVDKHISRMLDNKYRYPYVTLPKALKNHMNRGEIEEYLINQRQYRRRITKSRSVVDTNNRRKNMGNFDKIMTSLRLEDPEIQGLQPKLQGTPYSVKYLKRPKTAHVRRRIWKGDKKTKKQNRPRTASIPERTLSGKHHHNYLRQLAHERSLYVANIDKEEVPNVGILKKGSIYSI